MKKITNYFILLFLTTFSSLAQVTSEPPDFPNTGDGPLVNLLTGINTVNGTLQTPTDGQDRFQVVVPAGSQLDALTRIMH